MKKIKILSAASMASILFFAVLTLALTATSCKNKQAVTKGSTEVEVACTGKEFQSDRNYFRASQNGNSPDLATAKKIALQNARNELAGTIQTMIKSVTEQYTNQRQVSDQQEFESKFEENARAIVRQTLNDTKIICDKVFEKDGKYTYYITIEMNKDNVGDGFAGAISKDAKLQLEFDKAQFKKIYDEEMQKFENQ